MEKPKRFIHWEDSSRTGGDVVIGRFVLPVLVIIWGVFIMWVGTMIYGAVWDIAFDGDGAGVTLFALTSAAIFVPLGVAGIIRGMRLGWNMIKEANDRSLR